MITPLNSETFDPTRITKIQHSYHDHPFFQLDALEGLAQRLYSKEKCRFCSSKTQVDSPFDHQPAPLDGRTLEDVFRRIDEPGSWIALYDVQLDKLYRELLIEVQEEMEALVHPIQTIHDVRAFIFISSAPSVTPFHIDRENNFWLQIRGHKKLTVWDHRDRKAVSAADVERFLLFGDLHNVKLSDNTRASGNSYDCRAGDGVYFPMTSPHMTESDPAWMDGEPVTISVGMVFYTDITSRNTRVNMMNYQLRSLGIEPSPPGQSQLRDRVKAIVGRSIWQLMKPFRKS